MKTFYLRKEMSIPVLLATIGDVVYGLIRDKEYKISITLAESARSVEQNAKMWAMLSDISDQCEMPVPGALRKATKEEWKDYLTALLVVEETESLQVAFLPGGQCLALGLKTSKMGVKRMNRLIEVIEWFAAEKNVAWKDKREYLERYVA